MKVFVIQSDVTGTMASVVNPVNGTLLYAGKLYDAVDFIKSRFELKDEQV